MVNRSNCTQLFVGSIICQKDFLCIYINEYYFIYRMAESYNPDAVCDVWYDPFCDLCYEADDLNVKAASFCDDCVQFMCNKCYKIHERLSSTRGHVVKTGTAMPRSQADKPPRFSFCDEHPKHLKNQFCSVHKQLICSLCSPLYHKNCSTGSVEDVSKSISSSETNDLYDIVSDMKCNLESSLTAMKSNIDDLNGQKTIMLEQAQELYDKMVSKAKKWFADEKSEIDTHYKSQLLVLKQNHTRINNFVSRIESSLGQIDILRSKPIDAKLFLRIQDILSDMKQYQDDFKAPICNVQLSFVPSKQLQDYLSSSYTMGSVKLDKSKCEITIPEILYPVSSTKQSRAGPANKVVAAAGKSHSARQSIALTQLKGRKLGRYNVKLSDDRKECYIKGMAITNDGRRLLVDENNKKVKLFSQDMKLLSSLSLSFHPRDIAVISDKEAVVTTYKKSLVLLDISSCHMSINNTTSLSYVARGISKLLGISGRQLSITDTTRVSYDVRSIIKYGEKLVVTSYSPRPASVKLIDKTGSVYWSVSTDDRGQWLFTIPRFVTSDVERNTVAVTDCENNTLTVLNGDTGDVIKRRSLEDKFPLGVTTGPSGHIYACYFNTGEVAELTGDLAVERILLSQQDGLGVGPWSIAYDKSCGQLITSYANYSSDANSVDVWELS